MRRSFTSELKLKVIKYAEEQGNKAAAGHFKVDTKRIWEWTKKKSDLLGVNRRTRSLNKRGAKWPALEKELKEWILNQRGQGFAVSGVMGREEALNIARRLGDDDFKGTSHWCNSFMSRNTLSMRIRTGVGQHLPVDYEERVHNFRQFVKEAALGILPTQVGNMDEVPVPFDVPLNRTIEIKGTEDVFLATTGHHRTFFTVVLTVLASGEKLPPMIIFKLKNIPNVQFPEGVIVKANKEGWFNNGLMKPWIDEVWNKRQCYDPDPEKSLIIMDSAPSHKHSNARTELKKVSKVAMIPGGCTSRCQPLDVAINKPFKDNLRVLWTEWMRDPANATYTARGNRRGPGYAVVADMVKKAFDAVKTETIVNGFNKALLSDQEKKMRDFISDTNPLTLDDGELRETDDLLLEDDELLDYSELGASFGFLELDE